MNRVLAFDHMKKQYGIVAFKCLPGLLVFLLSKFQILSTSLYHLTSVGKKSCPRLSPTSLTSVSYSKCLLVRKIGLGNNECMSYGIINKKKFSKYTFYYWLGDYHFYGWVKIIYTLSFTYSKGLSVLKYWCSVIMFILFS